MRETKATFDLFGSVGRNSNPSNLVKFWSMIVVGVWTLVLNSPVVAQSTYHFQNLVPSAGIDAPVFDAQGNRLAGANYAAELWGGAMISSLSPTIDFSSRQRLILPFLTGLGAGYFTSINEMTVWVVPPGSFAWLQVRAWDTRLGATYEETVLRGLGGYGESSPFFAQGGNPTGLPTLPRPLIGLQSFSLRPVIPEPSMWALLALGGAALWWALRRRLQRRL
jgi:hypothetical protein